MAVRTPRNDREQAVLECRTFRHTWELLPPQPRRAGDLGPKLHFRCTRCGAVRQDTIRPYDGEIITRHYSLPADYKVFRGLTTSRKRLLWMRTQRSER